MEAATSLSGASANKAVEKPSKQELDRRLLDDPTKDLRWLPIDRIGIHYNTVEIDGVLGYQRPLNPHKIETMVDEFDPAEITAIVVSERADGSFWVVDGQHRLEALKLLGRSVILADIRHGLTFAQESRLFYRLNKGQTKVATWDQFIARLPWDPVAQNIMRIIAAYGYHTERSGNSLKGIAAVRSVEKVYRRGFLEDVMDIISRVWRTDHHGIDGPVIEGLGIFLYSYSQQDAYDRDRLLDILSVTPAGEVLQKQRQLQVEMGRQGQPAVMVAMALRDIYNGRRRTYKKLSGPPMSGSGKPLGYVGKLPKKSVEG